MFKWFKKIEKEYSTYSVMGTIAIILMLLGIISRMHSILVIKEYSVFNIAVLTYLIPIFSYSIYKLPEVIRKKRLFNKIQMNYMLMTNNNELKEINNFNLKENKLIDKYIKEGSLNREAFTWK